MGWLCMSIDLYVHASLLYVYTDGSTMASRVVLPDKYTPIMPIVPIFALSSCVAKRRSASKGDSIQPALAKVR